MSEPVRNRKVVPIRPPCKTCHQSHWGSLGRQAVRGLLALVGWAIYAAAIWWVTGYLFTGKW